MATFDATTELERQLSSLFHAEAQDAHLPAGTWQLINPKMGEPDALRLFRRVLNVFSLPQWRNPMNKRYAASAATIALAVLAAALFVLLVNDDEDGGGPVPAGNPTADVPTSTPPVRTETPFGPTSTAEPSASPTSSLMQVEMVDDFGEPVAGTAFEELLLRLPDNPGTRRLARLVDFAGPLELIGFSKPLPSEGPEAAGAFIDQYVAASNNGFAPNFPDWPTGSASYFSEMNWYENAAFNNLSVDQHASAGVQFGIDPVGDGFDLLWDVALGQFDPVLTASALAACECDQPDVRSHAGIEYLSWGESGVGNLRNRFGAPLYDYIGRGPRLLVREGEAYWTIQDAAMEAFTETLSGAAPSLGEDETYISAVRWLVALGVMREIAVKSSGLGVDDISQVADPEEYRSLVRETPLLAPFELAAAGDGFDGEQRFSGLVIAHADEAAARENLDVLLVRLREGRIFTNDDQKWSSMIERAEVGIEGRFIVARIYFRPQMDRLSLTLGNTLVLHE